MQQPSPAERRQRLIKLRGLTGEALTEAAGLMDLAEKLRTRALRLELQAEQTARSLAQIRETKARFKAATADAEAIGIEAAARKHRIDSQTMAFLHDANMQQKRRAARKNTYARIMQLARKGFSNREIARQVRKPDGQHYHPASISRIIQKELRDINRVS